MTALLLIIAVLAGCTYHAGARPASSAPPSPPPVGADLRSGRSDPVADPLYPGRGNADLDVLHYDLVLGWVPGTKLLTGAATLTVSAVASGEFAGQAHGPAGDTFTWHGSYPQASYLTTLAIGHYARIDETGPHGVPVTIWTRSGTDDEIVEPLRQIPQMLGWLESRFGRYPFQSAGVVSVASTSAMETQEMVTLGGLIAQGAANRAAYLQEVILHELSHQWFGDAATPTDWRALWLNEGFATWIQFQWEIEHNRLTRKDWMASALKQDGDLRRRSGPPGAPHADAFAEPNVYTSAALLLQAIYD